VHTAQWSERRKQDHGFIRRGRFDNSFTISILKRRRKMGKIAKILKNMDRAIEEASNQLCGVSSDYTMEDYEGEVGEIIKQAEQAILKLVKGCEPNKQQEVNKRKEYDPFWQWGFDRCNEIWKHNLSELGKQKEE
jgi:hypothetical protein